jgi:hypothetical protein
MKELQLKNIRAIEKERRLIKESQAKLTEDIE